MLDNKDLEINSVKLEYFLRASHSAGSNYPFRKVWEYLSMNQTRKRILGSNEKFDEIANRIIRENEIMESMG